MLNFEIVVMKLRDFGINYSIKVEEDYLEFIFKSLEERNFTNKDFTIAIDNFMEKETTTFNKMPNLAMLLKYSNKQPLTIEDGSKIKASEVMSWLEKNVSFDTNHYYNPPKKHIDTAFTKFEHKFENNLTNYVIEREFGSMKGMIERYGEQKIAGYTGLFKKELVDMFRVQGLYKPDKFVEIEDKQETKNIKNIVNGLGRKLSK